ncbi:MAG: MotA/TolQ/ExbB proton channel family protein [Polyangiaceae bacterium]|jgi:biopolymer transport protein ExbB/biopolymer transport protein TolQ|nr:MotA/TolQ/ExbB proton channel family protein [Polyangiaceae bacterium]
MKFTLIELWGHMGIFARAVVGVLLAMSILSLYVVIDRAFVFYASWKNSKRFAEKMAPLLVAGELDRAAQARFEGKIGYLGRVISAGLGAFRSSPQGDDGFVIETVARALERQSAREVQNLKRGQGVLATVSSTAPFVGLLGTVMGIVTAFEQMAATGSGGLGTVSAGIAEALVTTAFGLLVAIPSVMCFNWLQNWIDARAIDISTSSNEMLDGVSRALRTRRIRDEAESEAS